MPRVPFVASSDDCAALNLRKQADFARRAWHPRLDSTLPTLAAMVSSFVTSRPLVIPMEIVDALGNRLAPVARWNDEAMHTYALGRLGGAPGATAVLYGPTSSFFSVSTAMAGCRRRWTAPTCRAM